ncbi:MAG: cysteine hydrolase [Paenibacillus sp.]|jgi:nicotinamidase-related amidase|nr:cysteine hydrolase [Paenibacillus sp.]
MSASHEMKTALLILDIQKDFVGAAARMPVAPHHIEPMIDNINALAEKAKLAGIPVVYVGNEFPKTQWIANWFRRQAAVEGSDGAQLDERLHQAKDAYFSKKRGDALSNRQLRQYLKDRGIRHVIITGLFAEGCVTATARGALHRHFHVTVIHDAVAGATDSKRDAALARLNKRGVFLSSSSEIFGNRK